MAVPTWAYPGVNSRQGVVCGTTDPQRITGMQAVSLRSTSSLDPQASTTRVSSAFSCRQLRDFGCEGVGSSSAEKFKKARIDQASEEVPHVPCPQTLCLVIVIIIIIVIIIT